MKEMAQTAAKTLIQIPDDQQVVVAFRLLYLPWEDTSGLPGLLIAKADRRSALRATSRSKSNDSRQPPVTPAEPTPQTETAACAGRPPGPPTAAWVRFSSNARNWIPMSSNAPSSCSASAAISSARSWSTWG